MAAMSPEHPPSSPPAGPPDSPPASSSASTPGGPEGAAPSRDGTTVLRVDHFTGPAALLHGLAQLRKRGVTPRGLLFLALDPRGEIYLASPEDADAVTTIKVGEKLGLSFSLEGRFFHYDSLHRLSKNIILFNGDRRLSHPGDMIDVSELISDFLKVASARNVFFGCTPHQPGSWLVRDGESVALHERGMVEAVPVARGILARRIVDHRLYFLPQAALAETNPSESWQPVFDSPLGNLLMLERRIIGDRLVMTCEHGLVEVDVSALPRVEVLARLPLDVGFGVVGRVEGAAFAVTRGTPMPWGLDEMQPALLVGAEGASLAELGRNLAGQSTPS
jgi:hypothetical protein